MNSNSLLSFLWAVVWALLPFFADAQSVSIKVKDKENEEIPGSTVTLRQVADTSKVDYASTDAFGIAEFKNIADGLYALRITNIGFQPLEKTISVKPQNRFFEYKLKESTVSINEITISAERPLIRQVEDKMIIDPTPMLSISSNTLEVLESTPGIFIDYESGIYLTSTTPAIIFINGREQKLSNQDMMNLLRNLPPGSIERIEVMRTPSTKYDAASSGGIVNIILKKGIKIGRFGNVNAGMNQGVFGNRFASFSLNNKGERAHYYINTNFNRNNSLDDNSSTRYLRKDTTLYQVSDHRQHSNQPYIGYGAGYDISAKTNISYDGRISYNDSKSEILNHSFIEDFSRKHLSESQASNSTRSGAFNISQDIGLNHKLDSVGSEWDTKFSYNFIRNKAEQQFNSVFTIPSDTMFAGQGENAQLRQFLLFQSDLTYFLPAKIKMESGIKSTFQNYDSRADFLKLSNGAYLPDTVRTNSFLYKESINAAYVQASKTLWAEMLLKAGCRLEHTFMNGQQKIPRDTAFTIHRVDLFPYVYLSRSIAKKFGVEFKSYFIYRRTISRPDYQNLNPFEKYIDPFSYETGNPALKPQFTDNIELNLSVQDYPAFAIGQNYTSDVFTSVVYRDTVNKEVSRRTFDNVGRNKETYMRAALGIPPGKRFFLSVGGQYNLNRYEGMYEGEPVVLQRGSWRLFTYQTLRLFKETKITMHGFMLINGIQGFNELNNFGALNFGISQSFLNKSLNISINGRDILRTMTTGFRLNQGEIPSSGERYSDNRRFGINIRYNFGIPKKDIKREMKAEEE